MPPRESTLLGKPSLAAMPSDVIERNRDRPGYPLGKVCCLGRRELSQMPDQEREAQVKTGRKHGAESLDREIDDRLPNLMPPHVRCKEPFEVSRSGARSGRGGAEQTAPRNSNRSNAGKH